MPRATPEPNKGRGYTQKQLNAAKQKKEIKAANLRYAKSPNQIARKAISNKSGIPTGKLTHQVGNANAIAKAAIKDRKYKNIARKAVGNAGGNKYVVPKGYEAIAKAAIAAAIAKAKNAKAAKKSAISRAAGRASRAGF